MAERILIMGAGGRLGHAAGEAFRDAGWHVRSLVRPGRGGHAPAGTEIVEVASREAAVEAAWDCAVVLNALNPLLSEWRDKAMPLAYSAIAAAEAAGATLLFPGNVYNFGAAMPPMLTEETPMRPTTRKGALRVEMEQRLREASDRGVQVLVLRAGDFFGGGRGSWFDLVIVKELQRQRLTYPGPDDVVHSWAYLPDLSDAFVKLAERRENLPRFASFGFPGHAITGAEMIATVEAVTGTRYNRRRMHWWFLKSFGRLMALGRELAELEYLWKVPHAIDGTALREAIGPVPHTPLKKAVQQAMRDLGHRV